jgi:hypothetical protein
MSHMTFRNLWFWLCFERKLYNNILYAGHIKPLMLINYIFQGTARQLLCANILLPYVNAIIMLMGF